MGDQEYNPCGCIFWNDGVAMRRLLSILRQTQAYCTDNECLNDAALPGPSGGPLTSDFFVMCLVFGFLAIMFALRPRSLRRKGADDTKTRDNGPDRSGDPPVPPPTAN